MVKIRVTDKGIIQEPGSGFEGSPSSVPSQTRAASATLTTGDQGVCVLTASQGVLTMVMPPVAGCPGAFYVVRSSSPSAHILTSSQDAGNVIFAGFPGNAGNNASSITFPATAGSCVGLMSTGAHWMIMGTSGSMTLAKGVP